VSAAVDEHPATERDEVCALSNVRKVAAMLDLDPDGWRDGDILPRGWHFVLMGAETRRSDLRSDGYPGLGLPVPDLGLPRLRIAGRSVRFGPEIRIGQRLTRSSRIASLARRDNGTARLVVEHSLHDGDALCLAESQTFALLPERPNVPQPGAGPAALAPAARTRVVIPDDILLFQFSALGFNSHRIHWDRAFARDVEGFPDLVVNGGLTTLLLTEFLRIDLGETLQAVKVRFLHPLFSGRPITLAAEPREGGWRLSAHDDRGVLAAEIEADT
jgi:3-methylfumaryl-CoA hydratase